ncbi:MAG: GDP-L-fucose synthase [Bauldia sp.]
MPAIYPIEGKKVYVAGHAGMVGSALMRRLASEDCEIVTADSDRLDLRRQGEAEEWLARNRPRLVFVAAAKVGGILANSAYPAEFLYDNLMIAANILEAARRTGVEKLIFLGSSCTYPRDAPQPIGEGALLSGPLEPTNQWYAVAKIAGIKLTQAYRRQFGCDFVAVQPANLYGPGDNFDPETSHAPAGLVRRFHEAKIEARPEVVVWGSGSPRREFLHVDDLADACVFVARHYSDERALNIGTGRELSIAEFAELIARTVGYDGRIVFDRSKPDGTPRKLLDVSRLAGLGWRARTALADGIGPYYAAYLAAAEAAAGQTVAALGGRGGQDKRARVE